MAHDGQQIVALDVCVSEVELPHPAELAEIWHHRRQRDRVSQHFMRELTLSDK